MVSAIAVGFALFMVTGRYAILILKGVGAGLVMKLRFC